MVLRQGLLGKHGPHEQPVRHALLDLVFYLEDTGNEVAHAAFGYFHVVVDTSLRYRAEGGDPSDGSCLIGARATLFLSHTLPMDIGSNILRRSPTRAVTSVAPDHSYRRPPSDSRP